MHGIPRLYVAFDNPRPEPEPQIGCFSEAFFLPLPRIRPLLSLCLRGRFGSIASARISTVKNVLESGGTSPDERKDGWLNRLVGMLPKSRGEAIAFAPTIPLALRGQLEVTSYAPSVLPAGRD